MLLQRHKFGLNHSYGEWLQQLPLPPSNRCFCFLDLLILINRFPHSVFSSLKSRLISKIKKRLIKCNCAVDFILGIPSLPIISSALLHGSASKYMYLLRLMHRHLQSATLLAIMKKRKKEKTKNKNGFLLQSTPWNAMRVLLNDDSLLNHYLRNLYR